jgi:hypothetical protein
MQKVILHIVWLIKYSSVRKEGFGAIQPFFRLSIFSILYCIKYKMQYFILSLFSKNSEKYKILHFMFYAI